LQDFLERETYQSSPFGVISAAKMEITRLSATIRKKPGLFGKSKMPLGVCL